MSKIYQKTKDVYIQRRNTNNNGFDEYPLSVIPDGIVTTDEASNLVMQRLTDLTFASASFAYRSRYSEFCISASWASASLSSLTSISASWAPMPTVSNSSSWASSSISSSYAYYALNGLSASWASSSISSSYALSASYAPFDVAPAAESSSWASSSISSSYALTASFLEFSGSNTLYLQCDDGNTYQITLTNYSGSIIFSIDQTPVSGTNGFINIGTVEIPSISSSWASSSLSASAVSNGSGNSVVISGSTIVVTADNMTAFTFGGDGGTQNISEKQILSENGFVVDDNNYLFNNGIIATDGYISEQLRVGSLDLPVNVLDVTGNISCSVITASLFNGTASYALYAKSASYALNGGGSGVVDGGSYNISASWASQSLSASTSNTSSFIEFDGNRSIKRTGYTGINVGGNNVSEFLDNFFFPFVPATVEISSDGTYYYETGSSQNFSIESTITSNDETLFGSASILRNGVVWNITGSPSPITFTFTDTGISESYSYRTYVQTDNNGTPAIISSSAARAISFIFPYLYGTSSTAGLMGTNLYDELLHQTSIIGNKTVNLVGSATYIYFCYPSSYGNLVSILDPNSFEIIGGFEFSSSVPVTSSGLTHNWMNTYKVYRSFTVSDPNGNHQFKYT